MADSSLSGFGVSYSEWSPAGASAVGRIPEKSPDDMGIGGLKHPEKA